MPESELRELLGVVAACHDAGIEPQFWWRDDDLISPSIKFDKLRAVAASNCAHCLVAVIPAQAESRLRRFDDSDGLVRYAVHGYKHVTHSGEGDAPSEFPEDRAPSAIEADLLNGKELLREIFGHRLLPVLVPPWNRFAPCHTELLVKTGFWGFSSIGSHGLTKNAVRIANVHIDILRWGKTAEFHSPSYIVSHIIKALSKKLYLASSTSRIGLSEPIGILTHHRVMSLEAWQFLERLIIETRGAGASWKDPALLFSI